MCRIKTQNELDIVSVARTRTDNLDRRLKLEQDRLRDEYFAALDAHAADLGLGEVDLLAGAAAAHLEQARNNAVDVDRLRRGDGLSGHDSGEARGSCEGGKAHTGDAARREMGFKNSVHGAAGRQGPMGGSCGAHAQQNEAIQEVE